MRIVRRWWIMVALLGAPLGFLVFLRVNPDFDPAWFSPTGHLLAVVAIAGCALLVAVVAVLAARASQQAGVVWLAIGCASVGVLLVGHGLTTPMTMHHGGNMWVSRLAYLSLLSFATSLLLAGARPDRALARAVGRHPLTTVLGVIVPTSVFVSIVVVDPTRFHGAAPITHENEVLACVSTMIVAASLVVMWRHLRRWHLGHDLIQLTIVAAAAMTIAAVLSNEHGQFAQLSWWDYHAYLLGAFGAGVYAVLVRGRRSTEVAGVLAYTFSDDPFGHIVRGYPAALRTLVHAVEVKDAYTHGHSQRTAELAVELGIELALPPERLRIIARGAYLHDLGKIAIPDQILNKPGALTAEERAVIETHPELGFELASSAPTLQEVLPVILHHHERLDGGGYPAGLGGDAIPLEARVVAVADVWDALTSDRAYRPGWSHERALAHIRAGSGTHFDPVVVDGLLRVVLARGVGASNEPGLADEAWLAAQTCHEIDHTPVAAAA